MKVGVACLGSSLTDEVSPQFGRCPFFLIVDSETMKYQAIDNPGAAASGAAGPAAVNELVNNNVEAVLAGEFGPKAQHALDLAGVRAIIASGPAQQAVAEL